MVAIGFIIIFPSFKFCVHSAQCVVTRNGIILPSNESSNLAFVLDINLSW